MISGRIAKPEREGMRDLRSFLQQHAASVWRIDAALSGRHVLTALQHELDSSRRFPVLLASQVTDIEGRATSVGVVTNLTASS